ncbi:acyl-CoA dehydrogenase family protein [Litorivivens sp.]|uniref:acyl-CoA dehydrogenase family protein n=1 Tax=Litorivivens sp. TaxID=2020868 RepID=UPI0035649983
MDFELNEDQRAFQDTARQFAQDVMAPDAGQWDATQFFPKDVLRQAGELGFMGLYTPESEGGIDLPRLDSALILEELAAACPSTAAYISIHNMALSMVARYGSEEVRRAFCPGLTAGEQLASYCLTEPNAGSDAGNLKTRAVRDGEVYRLTGSKAFISGAGDSDVLVVMARTGGDGPKGISAFVVPADASGISYGKKEEKMGWNSQPTRAINFDEVEVPVANRLGDEGQGFAIAMEGLDGGRINIATCSIGAAQACLQFAVSHVSERQQFGQRIADFQNTQFKLADMQTELIAARQMVRLAAFKLDTNHPEKTAYCAMAKRFATDVGFQVCNEALQLHGGYGYIREYPVERFLRDSRVHQILEGTNEIMRVILSRRILIEGMTEILR